MKKAIRIVTLILTAILIYSYTIPVIAQDTEENSATVLDLNLEDAVKIGIENSIDLKKVANEIELKELYKKQAKRNKNRLDDADESLNEAKSIPISTLPEEVQKEIESKISSGEEKIDEALDSASGELGDNLNLGNLGTLGVESTGDLMTTSANLAYEVTNASYDIYKNQIALLIQKNYYDVLKEENLLKAKKKAVDRAKKQYELVNDSYEAGLSSKEDIILADIYYKSTDIEYKKVEGDFKNAVIELKKSMNIPFETDIVLTDVLINETKEENLEEALARGIVNRLEMKQAVAEVAVYDLAFKETSKYYSEITVQYKEAKLLKDKAYLNFEQTMVDVESSIRKSYETLKATGEMLNEANDMLKQAEESVKLAEYKYQEGFGVDGGLLKTLDLESASGTIMEVLAAEENLANVEEKVVEIMYGYNLAKMKYNNDAGNLMY